MSKEAEVIYKVRGILTSYEYGVSPVDKSGKKKHRIGIKVTPEVYDSFKAAIEEAGVYEGVNDAFKPKWIKEKRSKDDDLYINFSSSYDIHCIWQNDDGSKSESTLGDLTADEGVLHGSKVTVSVPLKKESGALYPRAVAIVEKKVVSFSDCFDDDDFLPFT